MNENQILLRNRGLRLLAVISLLLVMTSCLSSYEQRHEGSKVEYHKIFPLESSSSSWYFSDDDGNSFSIQVVDTISDDGDTYFKTQFSETKLGKIESHWFLMNSEELLYSPTLRGSYTTFLPKRFKRGGGSFDVDDNEVNYIIHDYYKIRGRGFDDVVELFYSSTILNGFSRVAFANNVGPVRFVDDSGRWPVEYDLDSAFVQGKILIVN